MLVSLKTLEQALSAVCHMHSVILQCVTFPGVDLKNVLPLTNMIAWWKDLQDEHTETTAKPFRSCCCSTTQQTEQLKNYHMLLIWSFHCCTRGKRKVVEKWRLEIGEAMLFWIHALSTWRCVCRFLSIQVSKYSLSCATLWFDKLKKYFKQVPLAWLQMGFPC